MGRQFWGGLREARRRPGSEQLGEAAVGDVAEHEVAVDPLDHVPGALRPGARVWSRDAPHHLRVAALVDAVLGPGARVVLGARHLDEGDATAARIAAYHVRVRVPGEVD